jgi:uncharacterized membrane protein YeaQ/YmgE (transglycosylase-associated protein family)
MTVLEFVIFLVAGAICAAIAGSLLGVRTGFLGSIVVGWVGAFVGTWVARETGLPELFVLKIGTAAVPIVWTIAGSFLLLLVVGLFRRGVRR